MFIFNSIFFFLPLLFFSIKQTKEQRQYTIHGYAQGTDYTVKYFAKDSLVTKHVIDSMLVSIDSSMSLYKPYSLINQFNNSQGGIRLDNHFAKVMRKSFEVYRNTAGKFDVTVKPLVQAWGFGVKPVDHFPDSAAIKNILNCVGMYNLELKGNYLKKDKSCIQI